jgi:IS1 family transposase
MGHMNKTNHTKRTQILRCLVDGNSIRATSRICDCAINTVVKLSLEAGRACAEYQDRVFHDLACQRLQCDEIWSFVYAKEKNAPEDMKAEGKAGDVWTWTAVAADTKLIPCWHIGSRGADAAQAFMTDLASRMRSRIQLTTDGHAVYLQAVEAAFGGEIDYAMLVKLYGAASDRQMETRYSPAICTGAKKSRRIGHPDPAHVSTSFCERANLTMRMNMRRFTRLTNAFSKKVENHACAVALHFMNYNFCRIHQTLRVTPAMAAGITGTVWEVEDIVNLIDGIAK